MESKGKELLPKIQEVVDALHRSKPQKETPTATSNIADSGTETLIGEDDNLPPPPPPPGSNNTGGGKFDLSLPIDLPGLVPSSNKKDIASSITSGNKGGKAKPKLMESATVKEPKNGGIVTKLKNEVRAKPKEREEAEICQTTEEGTENEDTAERLVMAEDDKTKDKLKPSKAHKSKRTKEKVIHEKSTTAGDSEAKVEKKTTTSTDALKNTSTAPRDNIDAEANRIDIDEPVDDREMENCDGDNSPDRKSESEKKYVAVMPSRRRSARLASFTEKNADSDPDSGGTGGARKDQASSDHEEVQQTRQHKKLSSGKVRSPCRKRAKIINSSSDESGGEDSRSTRHTRRGSPNRRKEGKGNIDQRWKSKSRKRLRNDQESVREGMVKISRRDLSRTASPNSISSTASAGMDKPPRSNKYEDPPKPSRRKSLNPQKLRASKSPIKSPPVVTRSNRHVKPNKKYYDSEEMETSGDDERSCPEEENVSNSD